MNQNKKNIKSPKVKVCEVCQQIQFLSEQKIIEVVNEHSNCIEKYAYILHDKDVDENNKQVSPHIHLILKFKNDDGRELRHVAAWFGIAEQYVSRSTSKSKNKFLDMCRYLIHMNKENKHQYDYSEVHSNFDYKAFVSQKPKEQRKQEIIDLIMAGIITQLNYTEYITPNEYDKFRNTINNTFQYKINKETSIDRNMEVIYIVGGTGSGKTTFGKYVAEQRKLSVFISSTGKDLFDGYKQEECIILDDFRGDNMEFADILKLLDNFSNCRINSRYTNKEIGMCKLMILTSVMSIDEFYRNICPSGREPIGQIKRRCGIYMKMDKNEIHVYKYDSNIKDYVFIGDCENPLKKILMNTSNSKQYTGDELILSLGLNKIPELPKSNDSETEGNVICPF